jgi:PAP2 superfamily
MEQNHDYRDEIEQINVEESEVEQQEVKILKLKFQKVNPPKLSIPEMGQQKTRQLKVEQLEVTQPEVEEPQVEIEQVKVEEMEFEKKKKEKKKDEVKLLSPKKRRDAAYGLRVEVAKFHKKQPLLDHPNNGDEERYSNKIASFSKALPHNELGEVDLVAYEEWVKTLQSGKSEAFESIPLGGVVKLVDPQAAYVYDLVGADPHYFSIAVAPEFDSAWEAAEMVELYWQALTRDVPFADYEHNRFTRAAAADLSKFSDFRGPKSEEVKASASTFSIKKERVTTKTLFRGDTPGDLLGPYLSQFLCENVPYGATTIVQKYRTAIPGKDYMTSYENWLNIQNGASSRPITLENIPRYIRNNRDLGEFVHQDFSYQACLSACLILLGFGQEALAQSNPYLHSKTQAGFVTFGAPHILDLVGKSAKAALQAAWFQKFLVHRRLRPEEFGGRVHNVLTGVATYLINKELIGSEVISAIHRKFGTYLLPMAYPEGCPSHTAYPSGHACFVGAGVTVLKAFFNEDFVIPNPVVASSNGLELLPYVGVPLTVGNELNKLASNVALGRCAAGVHWRTDASEGMKLGEKVAISMLQDYKKTYNEDFEGFTLTKFDGTTITI